MTLSPSDLKALATYRAQHGTSDGFVPIAPKKKRKNEEFSMQCALVSWWADNCARFGVPEFLLWHTPNSAVYGGSKAQREKMGAMLKRLGQRSGVSDLMLGVARGRWHGLVIEMKAPNGRLSNEQINWLGAMQMQGHQTATCHTLEHAQQVITEYLTP